MRMRAVKKARPEPGKGGMKRAQETAVQLRSSTGVA